MSGQHGQRPTKPVAVDPAVMHPHDDLPERVDGRALPARTARRWLAQLYADLGGEEQLSFMERSLCRRAVAFELWLGSVDARAQSGQDVTKLMAVYTQATNGLLGLYRVLGVERRQRDVPAADALRHLSDDEVRDAYTRAIADDD